MIQLSASWREFWINIEHLALAYVLTATIGWEREKEAHSAGVRTFPIVGMASGCYLLLMGYKPDSGDQSPLKRWLDRDIT
jgi:uncharacterized membrane protein YhiD involved in acid resistance